MNLQEAYRVMQKASGIEVGDTVRILRKFKNCELGSDCCTWDSGSSKKKMQGQTEKVNKVVSRSIWIDNYEFPFFALEIVEKAKSEKMITVRGKEYSEETAYLAIKAYVNG